MILYNQTPSRFELNELSNKSILLRNFTLDF
jgi:hypothetical protein